MHKLDEDTLITTDLLRKLMNYAAEDHGNGAHYAVIQKDNGDWLTHNPGSPELEPMQMMFARDVVALANREIAHDGAWLIVFTHPGALRHLLQSDNEYTRFNLIWMDRDGDVKFRLEWELGQGDELEFTDVLASGIHSWVERMEMAYEQWHLLNVQVLDARADQTFKQAKGERPPTLN